MDNSNWLRLRMANKLWGWEPHPTQEQWLMSNARTKIASCGRRWGKTEAAAIDAITMAILRQGTSQMIVAPTYDQSRLIFDHVERLALDSPLTRRLAKVTRTPYPRLILGRSVIMARTADEDGRNLRGHSADRVIVDEAAYVRDAVVQEVISPMLADKNGQLVMISTPFGKNHFYRAFLRGVESRKSEAASSGEMPRTARYASFSFPSWMNPHISAEYIEEQREAISPRQFAVEYEAQFVDDMSCVFAWEDINRALERGGCVSADREYVVAGVDWARYSDYTAVVAVAVNESGCEVVAVDRFNRMSWELQIARVVEFFRANRVSAALTDATSVGDPLFDQLSVKLWSEGMDTMVEGFAFTNRSKRDLIEGLVLMFAHGRIGIPWDEQLMRELQYFEYELTDSGNVRMNARTGFHDDLVIALALACRQAKAGAVVSGACMAGRRRVTAGFDAEMENQKIS